jgi:hypothetical protein
MQKPILSLGIFSFFSWWILQSATYGDPGSDVAMKIAARDSHGDEWHKMAING